MGGWWKFEETTGDGYTMIWAVLGVFAVPLLVLLNAFFVAAEFALVAVRRTRVDEMVNDRKAGAVAVKHAVENLDDAIAATQLGITLASLALGWVGEPSMARVVLPLFNFLPEGESLAAAHTLATILAFAMITFLHMQLELGVSWFAVPEDSSPSQPSIPGPVCIRPSTR